MESYFSSFLLLFVIFILVKRLHFRYICRALSNQLMIQYVDMNVDSPTEIYLIKCVTIFYKFHIPLSSYNMRQNINTGQTLFYNSSHLCRYNILVAILTLSDFHAVDNIMCILHVFLQMLKIYLC